MAKIRKEEPESLSKFVDLLERLRKSAQKPLWFRGCGKSSHKLLPSLYRHKAVNKISDFIELEKQLLVRFRQRSKPFHSRSLKEDWEALFFMQHYGVPTRLLDWTENPFIAFYFAVMDAPYETGKKDKLKFPNTAVVWILDPTEWNLRAVDEGSILTPDDTEIRAYRPCHDHRMINKHPVAIYGSHNSPRIVAQRGVFVIFGAELMPMEKTYEKENFPTDCLVKVILKRRLLAEMRTSILDHGITESVVFPDRPR